MDAMAAHVLSGATLTRFNSQELANTVWSFASLGLQHPELMDAIGTRLL